MLSKKSKKIEEGAYRLSNLIDKHFLLNKLILLTIPDNLWGAYEVLDDEIFEIIFRIFREPIKNQFNKICKSS